MKIAKSILFLLAALTLLAASFQAPKGSKEKARSTTSQTSKIPSSNDQVDINSASADVLKSLPGIGEAYSAAIIKNRPYANKRQLLSRKVIPQATYDKISDRIIAKQGKAK